MSPEMKKALNKAKIALLEKGAVFYSTLLFALKVDTKNCPVPTAAVDGTTLFLDEGFFLKLSPEERLGLLAHEVSHLAFQHLLRLGDRDPWVFNIAGDHVINLGLLNAGYSLPANGCYDRKYTGMTTEQVYDDLMKDPPPKNEDLMDVIYSSGTKEEQEELEQKIMDVIIRGATQAKMKGCSDQIPGEIQIALDKLLNPKLPWNVILANYMNAMAKEDFTFRRPNRRFLPDHYLPSLYSESLGHVAVAVDTSGSVSDAEFKCFASEINHIQERLNPQRMSIVDFDTSIRNIHEISQGDDIKNLRFSGRGGTDLYPVFKHFDSQKPQVLIVFSDLECRQIEDDPGYPVIWICISNPHATVKFGKLIHFEV